MFEAKVNLFLLFETWLHFYPAQWRRVKNWLKRIEKRLERLLGGS